MNDLFGMNLYPAVIQQVMNLAYWLCTRIVSEDRGELVVTGDLKARWIC